MKNCTVSIPFVCIHRTFRYTIFVIEVDKNATLYCLAMMPNVPARTLHAFQQMSAYYTKQSGCIKRSFIDECRRMVLAQSNCSRIEVDYGNIDINCL